MESFGAFLDEEFESLSRLFSNPDYKPDFLNSKIPPTASAFETLFLPTDYAFDTNSFFHNVSEESSNGSQIESALFPNNLANNLFDQSINFYTMDCNKNDGFGGPFPDNLMGEVPPLEAEAGGSCKEMQLKRKNEEAQAIQIQLKSEDHSPESAKKRARVCRNGPKNKKKNKKVIEDNNDEEEINGGTKQSTSSCSSGDDYNASQELNGGSTSESKSSPSLNSNGKARASRGSATDPQSLYARRRRERINERLRILQNLVPNGTKVDISTMLEEAVHYVKFLQLQIKLLSSDDLWMYAPLAYNGMDIGIYQKIMPNLLPQN